jgi:hypothetical protein
MTGGDRATTAIARPLPVALTFTRIRSGFVSFSGGGQPIRCMLTRLTPRRWHIERARWTGTEWSVFEVFPAPSLKAASRWCEDAARNDGLLAPIDAACRRTRRAAARLTMRWPLPTHLGGKPVPPTPLVPPPTPA